MTENLRPSSLVMAPALEHVFTRPDYHAQYFLPLLTVELSEIFDDLNGAIHFIDPIEPYDGCIGEFTKEFHNYYCRMNWVSFKVKDGLYDFEASENFFSKHYWKSHQLPATIHETVRVGWVAAVDDHYTARANEYAKWRNEQRGLSKQKKKHRFDLGGKPHNANWAHLTDFPLFIEEIELPDDTFPATFYYPLTEGGRRFKYIGNADAFDWRCTVHLFYDPVEQRALQTFDWT